MLNVFFEFENHTLVFRIIDSFIEVISCKFFNGIKIIPFRNRIEMDTISFYFPPYANGKIAGYFFVIGGSFRQKELKIMI